jgi:hypothetical protein
MPAPFTQKAPLHNGGVGDQIHNSARKVHGTKGGEAQVLSLLLSLLALLVQKFKY